MSVGRPEDDPATVNYLEVVRLRALLDEERAKNEGLRAVLRNTRRVLTVPAAEYVPAIGDAFDIINAALSTSPKG